MSEKTQSCRLSLEERIARLEGALGWGSPQVPLRKELFYSSAALLVLALFLCIKGFGYPNHYYQVVFAALTIILLYHRGWFAYPTKAYQWAIAVLDTLALSIILKLFIGSGIAQPLAWLRVPQFSSGPTESEGLLDKVVPSWSMSWEPAAISSWPVDLTIIQTFLLIITLMGALFNFQPFASLTAVLLVLVSIPALATFNWDWLVPALIVTSIAFYLQTAGSNVNDETQ